MRKHFILWFAFDIWTTVIMREVVDRLSTLIFSTTSIYLWSATAAVDKELFWKDLVKTLHATYMSVGVARPQSSFEGRVPFIAWLRYSRLCLGHTRLASAFALDSGYPSE